MATESEPVYVPVEVDEDGYLRVRTVVTQLDPVDVVSSFLAQQDPALVENDAITKYPECGPVEGALRVLADNARGFDG